MGYEVQVYLAYGVELTPQEQKNWQENWDEDRNIPEKITEVNYTDQYNNEFKIILAVMESLIEVGDKHGEIKGLFSIKEPKKEWIELLEKYYPGRKQSWFIATYVG